MLRESLDRARCDFESMRQLVINGGERIATLANTLELIAATMRPDGTWNRDRAACQQLALIALGVTE
jgi:hypothetical protein